MPRASVRLLIVLPAALVIATLGVWAYRTLSPKPAAPGREIRVQTKTVAGIAFEVEYAATSNEDVELMLVTSPGVDSIRFARRGDVLEYESGLLTINEIGMPDVTAGDVVRWNLEGPLLIDGKPAQPHPLQARPIEAPEIDAQWVPLESPYPRDTLSVTWAGSSRLLVAAHGDGAIRVWDVDKREVLKTLIPDPPKEGRGKFGLRAAVSSDGKTIAATNMFAEEVGLWDVSTGNRIAKFPEPTGQNVKVKAVAFWGEKLLEARGGQLISRNVSDGSFQFISTVHADFAVPFAIHNGRQLLAINGGTGITWYTGPNFRTEVGVVYPAGTNACFAFSADGNRLAVFDGDNRLLICDTAIGGKAQRRLHWRGKPGAAATIHAVAFSPDGQTLAVGDNESIRFYDVPTGRERGGLATPWVRSLAYSADGRTLAAGLRYQPGLRLWETADLVAK
jgi:WD40 repeat protein